jgi:hypothetical protein
VLRLFLEIEGEPSLASWHISWSLGICPGLAAFCPGLLAFQFPPSGQRLSRVQPLHRSRSPGLQDSRMEESAVANNDQMTRIPRFRLATVRSIAAATEAACKGSAVSIRRSRRCSTRGPLRLFTHPCRGAVSVRAMYSVLRTLPPLFP